MNKKEKTKKICGYIMLFLGIVGLTSTFVISYIGEKQNKEMMQHFELDNLLGDSFFEDSNENNADSSKSELNIFSGNTIAILSVPSVNIKYPVVKGTSSKILKTSLGYFENTALPGQKGNFAVAGHRNSSYAKYFNRLDEVKPGDEIIVETKDNKYTYIVDKTLKIHESETDVLKQSEDARITLITCTNGFKPKYRIVVQGYLQDEAK